jgi:serine/threonine-protein kinase
MVVMLIGRYEVVRKLREGGMGEVLLARDPDLEGPDCLVVVKRMHRATNDLEQYAAMFRNETRLLALLNHPNIPRFLYSGKHEGAYYLVMEHVHGADLDEVLERPDERLTPALVAHITASAAAALHHAHGLTDDQGNSLEVVHRDISPNNVRIGHDGAVKVIDFGVAKAATQSFITAAGVTKGKFPYMSPEQVEGGVVDAQTDIFALGIVMHEMLTYRQLFAADEVAITISAIQSARIPRPSELTGVDVPDELEAIVMRALERDRQLRYPSAELMQRDLEAYLRRDPAGSAELSRQMTRLYGDANEQLARVTTAEREQDLSDRMESKVEDRGVIEADVMFDEHDEDEYHDEDATVRGRPALPRQK